MRRISSSSSSRVGPGSFAADSRGPYNAPVSRPASARPTDRSDRPPPEAGLADRLREASRELHVRAERSGIVADLLNGRASHEGYVAFLRGLLPVYEALEAALERHRDTAGLAPLARPEVYRSAAIADDLEALVGPEWRAESDPLEPAARYARRLSDLADGPGDRLLAHAYVRYLGDLNGGQVVRRLLESRLGLPVSQLGFYEFPAISDPAAFRASYRRAVDEAAPHVDVEAVVDETRLGFRLNIELSEAAGRVGATPLA